MGEKGQQVLWWVRWIIGGNGVLDTDGQEGLQLFVYEFVKT